MNGSTHSGISCSDGVCVCVWCVCDGVCVMVCVCMVCVMVCVCMVCVCMVCVCVLVVSNMCHWVYTRQDAL